MAVTPDRRCRGDAVPRVREANLGAAQHTFTVWWHRPRGADGESSTVLADPGEPDPGKASRDGCGRNHTMAECSNRFMWHACGSPT